MITVSPHECMNFTSQVVRILVDNGYHVNSLNEALAVINSITLEMNRIEAYQDTHMWRKNDDA